MPDGTVSRDARAHRTAQKSAIYNAVLQQRVRGSTTQIPGAARVGAPVSPAVELADTARPGGGLTITASTVLKYAMVEDDVVVVDPVKMRVVEIIHGNTRP